MLQEHLSLTESRVMPCGEEQAVYHISKALAEKGVEVHIISSKISASGFVDGVFLSKVRKPFDIFSFLHKSNSEEFDIIHSHEVRRILLFALLRKHGQPLIVHYHGPLSTLPQTFGRSRFIMAKADMIVVPSQPIVDRLQQAYQLPVDKIKVVPNGVDTDLFRRVDSSETSRSLGYNIPQATPMVLFVGNVRQMKGLEILLKSIPIVLANVKETKFVFVGTSNRYPFFKHLVDEMDRLSIRENCILLPPVPQSDLQFFYSTANLLVQPSLHESFGMPVIEALACETPVVVSQAVGLSGFVDENKVGVIVKTGDHEDLGRGIIQLLTDEREARMMGRRGRRLVIERFGWSKVASTFLALYNELLQNVNRRA